ncbi:MAG: A/G-specific adenine glycosylase, partial [Chitinophagaceae bacterium]|nr:A/G-specific adenine glycosylase [Chitinophagaceae bacterium]
WQGLGYYSRCRNLMKTAQIIHQAYHGTFPETYEQLRELPGIGDYTAAAIASFAFKKPHAAVDGNVIRILSRYMANATDPSRVAGKRYFTETANALLDPKHPDLFNQAMMDLGATICTPQQARCGVCPLNQGCRAFNMGNIEAFPSKKKKNPLKIRHFHFAVFQHQDRLALLRRHGNDIWADLHTPWTIESADETVKWPVNKAFKGKIPEPMALQQVLSHQKIMGRFYRFGHPGDDFLIQNGLKWVDINSLKSLAFPRMVLVFLKNAGYL